MVMRRAKKRKNLSSARYYDQINVSLPEIPHRNNLLRIGTYRLLGAELLGYCE